MLRFLPSPSMAFTNVLLDRLQSFTVGENYSRILVHQITDGVRMRNLGMDLHLTIEVSGKMVLVTWSEAVSINSGAVPYMKIDEYTDTDISVLAERIVGFFEREWEIEKDA